MTSQMKDFDSSIQKIKGVYSNRKVLHAKSSKGVDKQDINQKPKDESDRKTQPGYTCRVGDLLANPPTIQTPHPQGFWRENQIPTSCKNKVQYQNRIIDSQDSHYNSNVTLRAITNKHELCMCLHLLITEKREEIKFHSHLFSFFFYMIL